MSPFFIPMLIVNMASGLVSMRFGAKGPELLGGHRLRHRQPRHRRRLRLIQRGDADVMIAGGAEAIIIPLTIAGFCR